MGWRKIRKEDIALGLCVRLTGMPDTAFNGATIVGIAGEDITFSRPMSYAIAEFSCKSGHLYAETFTVSALRLYEYHYVDVFEYKDGTLATCLLKCA